MCIYFTFHHISEIAVSLSHNFCNKHIKVNIPIATISPEVVQKISQTPVELLTQIFSHAKLVLFHQMSIGYVVNGAYRSHLCNKSDNCGTFYFVQSLRLVWIGLISDIFMSDVVDTRAACISSGNFYSFFF